MAPDDKGNRANRIPVNFLDGNEEGDFEAVLNESETLDEVTSPKPESGPDPDHETFDDSDPPVRSSPQADGSPADVPPNAGGPEVDFLSGVDLIYKQLNGVLDAFGVKPIAAEGEQFNPHLHEAVVTEETDEYEPDTVMQEIVRGFKLGDKLIRPSLVKVAVKK